MSQIKNIPSIRANGSNRLFGGYIYSISFDIPNTNSPGGARVEVVNESGDYTIPQVLSGINAHICNFSIGGFAWKGYLKSYRKIESSRGNTLSLDYIDGSWKLDKYYVGLYKKHGERNNGALIIVGEEDFPCGKTEGLNKNIVDWCYPNVGTVIGTSRGAMTKDGAIPKIDCGLIAATEILDVDYNWQELRGAIPIPVFGNIRADSDYRDSFTGSLREVISQWCSIFGGSFYFHNEAIYLVDLSVGIAFKDFRPDAALIDEVSTECSLDGTFSQGYSVNYDKNGQIKEYGENQGGGGGGNENIWVNNYNLTSLNLESFYGGEIINYPSVPGESVTLTSDQLETAAICYYYHQIFRDYFFWKNEHGGQFPATVGQKLLTLGGMKIIKVIAGMNPNSISSPASAEYKAIKSQLSVELQARIDVVTDKNVAFYIADFDENIYQQQLDFDKSASELLGRFFFRWFTEPYVNARGERIPSTFYSPDNLTYLAPGDDLSSLAISNYGHTPESLVAQLLRDKTAADDKYLSSPTVGPNGIIFVDRGNSRGMGTLNTQSESYYKTMKSLEHQIFYTVDGISLDSINADLKQDGVTLIVAFKPIVPIQKTPHPNSPFEKNANKVLLGNRKYNIGIGGTTCFKIKIEELEIYTPYPRPGVSSYNVVGVKSMQNWKEGGELTPPSSGAITSNGDIIIQKVEVTKNKSYGLNDGTVAGQWFERDVSDEKIPQYYDNNNNCEWDEKEIRNYLDKVSSEMGKGNPNAEIKKTYKCFGEVPIPNVTAGLLSAKIEIDDKGLFTEYVVGNTPAQKPSFEAIKDQIANMSNLKQRLGKAHIPIRIEKYSPLGQL